MEIFISVYFMLYILTYVTAEEEGKNIEFYNNQSLPCCMNCYTEILVVGYSWALMTMEDILPNGNWIFYLNLLISLEAALVAWTLGKFGRERGSLKWALFGALVAYPLQYNIYDESDHFLAMVIASSVLYDSLSKLWYWLHKIHILRWVNFKQYLIKTYNIAQHHGWYEVWKQIIYISDPHGERNAYKVLGLSQNSSQQEITSAWRRFSCEYHPDRVEDYSQRRAALGRFVEIQQAYELLSNSKSRRDRNNKKDNSSTDTSHTTTPVPIPSLERNAERAGESTSPLERSTLHHNMDVTPDISKQTCNRAHVDIESDIIEREYSTSESSMTLDKSSDNSYTKNIEPVEINQSGIRSQIVHGSRSSLNQSVNYSYNLENMRRYLTGLPTYHPDYVSSSCYPYGDSSEVSKFSDIPRTMPAFFNRSRQRSRQNRLSAKVSRFLKCNNLTKKEDITRFYGVKSHVRPIFGLASVLLVNDRFIFDYQIKINRDTTTFLSKFKRMSCKRCDKDDSVSSDSISESLIEMAYYPKTRN